MSDFREINVNVFEPYYQDLEQIAKIWEGAGRHLSIDDLINSSIDLFITTFYKNNKSVPDTRISKMYQHKHI